jgi:hypothetical protein
METAITLIVCGGTGLLTIVLVILAVRQQRIYAAIQQRINEQINPDPDLIVCIQEGLGRCAIQPLSQPSPAFKRSVIVVTSKRVSIYNRTVAFDERISFAPDQIRWFGRPQKYSPGINEIWLHIEMAGLWQIVKIRLYQTAMRDLVRALKVVCAPELVTAYRRQRPYIHTGPAQAYPAEQDIHGAWTLHEPVTLYLMPRLLVILQNGVVTRELPLERIQQIGALRRLDAPDEQGLVRFRLGDEPLAFALDEHESFAQALAEAAKRTLEAPLERKQKKQSAAEDFEEED